MTTTDLKEKTTQLKEKTTDFMSGELTLTKLDFFLIGAICLLAGICIGLLSAPYTHGVTIASNNGNNNGNNCGSNNGHNDNNAENCTVAEADDNQEEE